MLDFDRIPLLIGLSGCGVGDLSVVETDAGSDDQRIPGSFEPGNVVLACDDGQAGPGGSALIGCFPLSPGSRPGRPQLFEVGIWALRDEVSENSWSGAFCTGFPFGSRGGVLFHGGAGARDESQSCARNEQDD